MKFRLSSEYGVFEEVRNGRIHNGIDIATPQATPLRTITDGTIVDIVDTGEKGLGKAVYIETSDGQTHIYGHLQDVLVPKGYSVKEGEVIALSGDSGFSTGPHLHFAVKDGSQFVDPTPVAEKLASYAGENANIAVADSEGIGSYFLDKYNDFADYVIGKQMEVVVKPVGNALADMATRASESIYAVLPEIGGIITIAAGVMLMIPLIERGKVLGGYVSAMTGVIIWIVAGQ